MSRPKRSDAYPASMLLALEKALETGGLFIPCPGPIKPQALRLQFYGLIGALRAEGKTELANAVSIVLSTEPLGIWLRPRDLSSIGELVSQALASPGENPPLPEDPEDIFDRIMKGKNS